MKFDTYTLKPEDRMEIIYECGRFYASEIGCKHYPATFPYRPDTDASPWQENAIKILEDRR